MPTVRGQALHLARLAGGAALGLGLIVGLALLALCWRLSHGPLELPLLVKLLQRTGTIEQLAPGLEVQRLALAWNGYREADASPLELQVGGLQLRDGTGAVRQELPDATVSLSSGWLLRGRLAPLTVRLASPSVVLERGQDGQIGMALGRLSPDRPAVDPQPSDDGLLGELFGRGRTAGPLASLVNLTLEDGTLSILDRQLGMTWRMERVFLTLQRTPDGAAIDGRGQARLRLPGSGPDLPVSLSGQLSAGGAVMQGSLSIPSLQPGRVAGLLPALAPVALLDAPVGLNLAARFDGRHPDAVPELALMLNVGRGSFNANGRRVALERLDLQAAGTPRALHLSQLRLVLGGAAPRPGRNPVAGPTVSAEGDAALAGGAWRMRLGLQLSKVEAVQLNDIWPAELAPGARRWLVQNVTSGSLDDGRFTLRAEAAEDLSGLRLTELDGYLRLINGVVHWLRPIAPLEGVTASAKLGLKEIQMQVTAARQSGTAMVSPGTTIRFSQLDTNQEQVEIDARLQGPVPDAVALIRHPRLHLFDERPLELSEPGGQLDGRLQLAFPLKEDIPAEVFKVQFQARVTQLRLADVVMGKTLDRGTADLSVDNTRLKATGRAQLAGIPTTLALEMDFRPGHAGQVVERIQATARPDASRVAEFGLDLKGFVSGPIGVQVAMEKRRDGQMKVELSGDLRDSLMELPALAWRKPPGVAASSQGQLDIAGEQLRAVPFFQLRAPDLAASGKVSFAPGNKLDRVDLRDVRVFGSRFSGEAWPPAAARGAWRLRASGPVLDLRPLLATSEEDAAGADDASDGAPLTLDGHFDTVMLGNGRSLSAVQGRATTDRRGVFREARLSGSTGGQGGFDLAIVPRGAGRDLRLNAADAGALFRAFDLAHQVEGGRLSLEGRWTSNAPGAPLSGTADMSDFRFQDAAAAGKLLQALTVYGVFDAVRGPGLAFSRMVAPFTLTPTSLSVDNARAFSSSLGVTARGAIQRRQRSMDLQGTIVPAYALNSLLGYIPLLGRLFSPEQGGGLFAATWRMQGPLADPSVAINPLAALTPGFLRGVFGDAPAGAEARP
ncbi:DUF3971 domain-containing protein [Teichococcus vastitatis]|uniref:DUF3971 domain-containing protein n=1 Tax=Teichococcus vastitatis TaxID=2307076 RepID=A0ABS9W211_9PROT|nr:DUF3971 domain-containing protein [Pseudoroseomonas vastitatis]MCI0753334.1 DUF3971 domain-containing protein [Pseudoroseomonas vastitatis]